MARGATTAAQRLMSRSQEMTENVSEYRDEDFQPGERASIAHISPARVRVYKLTPSGSVPIEVSVQSLGGAEGVLSNPNYSPVCHDCGRDDCGPGINDCTGRPKRKFRVCPVNTCGKRVYDPVPSGRYLEADGMSHQGDIGGEEEEQISDSVYSDTTPEQRTKTLLDRHIIGYHEEEATTFGLRAPVLKDLREAAV